MSSTTAYVDASDLGKSRHAVSLILETAAAGGCGTTGGEVPTTARMSRTSIA